MKLINIMIPLWKSPIDPDDPFVEVSYQATRGATRASAAAGTWAVVWPWPKAQPNKCFHLPDCSLRQGPRGP